MFIGRCNDHYVDRLGHPFGHAPKNTTDAGWLAPLLMTTANKEMGTLSNLIDEVTKSVLLFPQRVHPPQDRLTGPTESKTTAWSWSHRE
jgi:hypothetical protein